MIPRMRMINGSAEITEALPIFCHIFTSNSFHNTQYFTFYSAEFDYSVDKLVEYGLMTVCDVK